MVEDMEGAGMAVDMAAVVPAAAETGTALITVAVPAVEVAPAEAEDMAEPASGGWPGT